MLPWISTRVNLIIPPLETTLQFSWRQTCFLPLRIHGIMVCLEETFPSSPWHVSSKMTEKLRCWESLYWHFPRMVVTGEKCFIISVSFDIPCMYHCTWGSPISWWARTFRGSSYIAIIRNHSGIYHHADSATPLWLRELRPNILIQELVILIKSQLHVHQE